LKSQPIGDIFTPLPWGEFAAEQYDIFRMWMQGATVFDPSMGEGNLPESLITCGLRHGHALKSLPVNNLFGNEIHTAYHQTALHKFRNMYQADMSKNFTNCDFFDLPKQQYDIIFSNPPWINFNDLPEAVKTKLKPLFFSYGLISSSKNLLLGGSRIDLAALFIQRSIIDFLKNNGKAVFFAPLSLFLNDGAHKTFRNYKINDVPFMIQSIHDFDKTPVFPDILTRYCLFGCIRDAQNRFPIPYFIHEENSWKEYQSSPMFSPSDSLHICSETQAEILKGIPKFPLPKSSVPRQGINTCGANDVFIFNEYSEPDASTCLLSNKYNRNCIFPKEYIYPLASSRNFKTDSFEESKWVFLPYSQSGKPITQEQIEQNNILKQYLSTHRLRLVSRKGTLINTAISKGKWWSMLGVGKYCFAPYKILWEAYGRSTFNPKIFPGHWQANQSLQAFIPAETLEQAEAILAFLKDSRIQEYLSSMRMPQTMNWAQPGKIKKLFLVE